LLGLDEIATWSCLGSIVRILLYDMDGWLDSANFGHGMVGVVSRVGHRTENRPPTSETPTPTMT